MKRRLLRRLSAALVCLSLCVGLLAVPAGAASTRTLAAGLHTLGLLKGVSGASGDFALDRAPTRVEALVMLIRVLGKEEEALRGSWTHPFADVPDWAQSYVGYAYETGLTSGVGDTLFGSMRIVDLSSYLTFVLRALGYSDQAGADFSWKAPQGLATQVGILPAEVSWEPFLRADLVLISYAALTARLKNSDMTLADRLIADQVFTQAQFDAAIRPDAFANSQAVHAAVSQALIHNESGPAESNVYRAESHVILELLRRENDLTVTVRFFCGRYTFRADGSSTTNGSSGIAVLTLRGSDGGPYQLTGYRSGSIPHMALSTGAQSRSDLLSKAPGSLQAVCTAQADAWRASPDFVYVPEGGAAPSAEPVAGIPVPDLNDNNIL